MATSAQVQAAGPPGSQMMVQTPQGVQMMVVVPQGVAPGGQFAVAMPQQVEMAPTGQVMAERVVAQPMVGQVVQQMPQPVF